MYAAEQEEVEIAAAAEADAALADAVLATANMATDDPDTADVDNAEVATADQDEGSNAASHAPVGHEAIFIEPEADQVNSFKTTADLGPAGVASSHQADVQGLDIDEDAVYEPMDDEAGSSTAIAQVNRIIDHYFSSAVSLFLQCKFQAVSLFQQIRKHTYTKPCSSITYYTRRVNDISNFQKNLQPHT